MKFKVLKGTELFQKFIDARAEMQRCEHAALDVMHEVGAKYVRGDFWAVAGGISAFGFEGDKKPEGWAIAYKDSDKDFFPARNRKANKELLDKIKALPMYKIEDFNEIMDYDYGDHDTNRISFHPVVNWEKEYVLISIASQYSRYKPVEGMIEITTSEYNSLIPKNDN